MKNLTATLCLTIAVLLGSSGMSWSTEKLSNQDDIILHTINKEKLRKIQTELKYLGDTDNNWVNNINHPSYSYTDHQKFLPSQIKFVFENLISDVKIDGVIIPQYLGARHSSNWGKALVTFTRVKDGKYFLLYVNQMIFSVSSELYFSCEGKNICEIIYKTPMIINNYPYKDTDDNPEPTFTFKDIDYDGEKELLVRIHLSSRQGAKIIAYNVINTIDKFELEKKPNTISVIYSEGHGLEFDEENRILKDKHYGGCCDFEEYVWEEKFGTYDLIEINESKY